jgi:hypothetical protein
VCGETISAVFVPFVLSVRKKVVLALVELSGHLDEIVVQKQG